MYPAPETFDPTRYLGDTPATDPRTFAFGFGRRVCPGREMADMSIWLSLARSLAAFDIRKPRDAHGVEIEQVVEYVPGAVTYVFFSFSFLWLQRNAIDGLVSSIPPITHRSV